MLSSTALTPFKDRGTPPGTPSKTDTLPVTPQHSASGSASFSTPQRPTFSTPKNTTPFSSGPYSPIFLSPKNKKLHYITEENGEKNSHNQYKRLLAQNIQKKLLESNPYQENNLAHYFKKIRDEINATNNSTLHLTHEALKKAIWALEVSLSGELVAEPNDSLLWHPTEGFYVCRGPISTANPFSKTFQRLGNLPWGTSHILQTTQGGSHLMVLTVNGLYGRGDNGLGELGLNHHRAVTQFEKIDKACSWGDQYIREVFTGLKYTFVWTTNGKTCSLYSCGDNSWGQLGTGNAISYCNTFQKAKFSSTSDVLFTNSQINIAQISAGQNYTLVLREDNTLFGCGYNKSGQLGLGDNRDRNTFTLINNPPWGTSKIIQVIASDRTAMIWANNGLYACGDNHLGQLGLGDKENRKTFTRISNPPWENAPILKIIPGHYYTLIWTTLGLYVSGQHPGLINKEGPASFCNTFTLIPNTAWQDAAILQVLVRDRHILVLTTNGLYGCGENRYGQLGIGDGWNYPIFTKITDTPWGNAPILQISGSYNYTLALTTQGLYWCGYPGLSGTGFDNGLRMMEQANCQKTFVPAIIDVF